MGFFSFIFYLWWIKPKKSPIILTPLTMDNKGNAQLSTSAVSSTNFQLKSQPNFSRSNLCIQYSFYNFNWALNYIRLKIEFGWNIENHSNLNLEIRNFDQWTIEQFALWFEGHLLLHWLLLNFSLFQFGFYQKGTYPLSARRFWNSIFLVIKLIPSQPVLCTLLNKKNRFPRVPLFHQYQNLWAE